MCLAGTHPNGWNNLAGQPSRRQETSEALICPCCQDQVFSMGRNLTLLRLFLGSIQVPLVAPGIDTANSPQAFTQINYSNLEVYHVNQ